MRRCPKCGEVVVFPGYFLQEYKINVGTEKRHGISKPRMKVVGYMAKPICPFCNSSLYDQPCGENTQ